MSGDDLELFTVYGNPRDYPGAFVVRRWTIGRHGRAADVQPHAVERTLEAARASLPDGLYCLGREPGDDPAIVEVWI